MKDFLSLGSHSKTTIAFFLIIILCVIFYVIKNFKTIDVQLKILLLIIILGAIAGMSLIQKEYKSVALLRSDFCLTTGNIDEYIVTKLKGKGDTGNSIKYIFSADDKFIVNSYSENYYVAIPDDKPDLSLFYFVIYEKTNPENSFILLNYPVKSHEDFEQYKKIFAQKIPDDAIKPD